MSRVVLGAGMVEKLMKERMGWGANADYINLARCAQEYGCDFVRCRVKGGVEGRRGCLDDMIFFRGRSMAAVGKMDFCAMGTGQEM